MKKMSLMLLAAVVCWSGGAYADSINVTNGFSPSGADPYGNYLAVRMRNFNNSNSQQEIFLGASSLGSPGASQVALAHGTPGFGATNAFTLEWDPTGPGGLLSFSLDNGPVTHILEYTSTYDGPLNYLQFSVKEAGTTPTLTGQVAFFDLVLNGVDVTGIPAAASPGNFDYYLSGINLTSGFTLTGVLELSGVFGTSAEASKIDIRAGYRDVLTPTTPFGPAVVPVPAAAWMGFLGIGMIAARRRLKKS